MSRNAPMNPQNRPTTHNRLSGESRDRESRSDKPSFKALVSLLTPAGLECPDDFTDHRRAGDAGVPEDSMPTRRIMLLIPALVLALAAKTLADTTPSSSGPLLGFSNDHA